MGMKSIPLNTKLKFKMPFNCITLEGGVAAGKSTVCSLLQKNHGFIHIPEYMDLALDPPASMLSKREPIDRFRFFLGIERLRSDRAMLHVTTKKIALDRSFFTLLAFEYAQKKMGKSSISINSLTKLEKEGLQIIIPRMIMFLDVSDQERLRRVSQRGEPILNDLVSPTFNCHLKNFFKELSGAMETIWIDSDLRTPELIAQSLSALDKDTVLSNSGYMTSRFPNYCKDLFSDD